MQQNNVSLVDMKFQQLSAIPTEGLLTRISGAAILLHDLQPTQGLYVSLPLNISGERLHRQTAKDEGFRQAVQSGLQPIADIDNHPLRRGMEKIMAAARIYEASIAWGLTEKAANKIAAELAVPNTILGRLRRLAARYSPKLFQPYLLPKPLPTAAEAQAAQEAKDAAFQKFFHTIEANQTATGLGVRDCFPARLRGFIHQSWNDMTREIPGLKNTELPGYTPKDIHQYLHFAKADAAKDLMLLITELEKRNPNYVSIEAFKSFQETLDKNGQSKLADRLYDWHISDPMATMGIPPNTAQQYGFVRGEMVPRPTLQQAEPPPSPALLLALGIKPTTTTPAAETVETINDRLPPDVSAVIGPDGIRRPYNPAPTGTTPTPAAVRLGHSSPTR